MFEKIKLFWKKGGYTIIILIVAFIIYLVGMDMVTSCYSDVNAPVEMKIDDKGILSIQYVYDDYENVHVLWETDGGNIVPTTENERFAEQNTDENKGYYCYTNISEGIKWSPEDNDGYRYTTANIRATLYDESGEEDIYNLSGSFMEVYMTVTIDENGKVVQTDDRYFTSPVREGSDSDWAEIYPIFIGKDEKVTYRYRTGKEINGEEAYYIRWQCNQPILCETDIMSGFAPEFKIVEDTSNMKALTQINAVTVDYKSLDSGYNYVIEAYIVDEEHYDDADISQENKINLAQLGISIME